MLISVYKMLPVCMGSRRLGIVAGRQTVKYAPVYHTGRGYHWKRTIWL